MGKKNEAYFSLETSTGEVINLLPVGGNADAIIMDVISADGWELTPTALGKEEALRLAVALNAFFDFGEDF